MNRNPDFEIQSVTHRADVICFTWMDTGGMYNVYKDGNHVYEGNVPEFSDGDFKHGKMYYYSIERVVGGDVVDVIALQTSAFAEQKNKENPLQSLVLTTIVAKSQIALSWEEMRGIQSYDIYRDGKLVKTVTENRYIDREFDLDETYTYSIQFERPLLQSEERFNVSMSVASRLFGFLNPLSSEEEAAVDRFSITKTIAAPRLLLTPVREKEPAIKYNRWRFRYSTFLADAWVVNPNIFSRYRYFKGDNRRFDPNGKTYRTRVDIELAYDLDRSPLTFTKDVGPTLAFNRQKQFRDKGIGSFSGITLQRKDHKEGEAGFHLTHAVENPLVPAPEIDYEVRAVMCRNGTFDLTGFHDAAPHHEIYMMRGTTDHCIPIHLAESKGLAWMSSVLAQQFWRFSNFE